MSDTEESDYPSYAFDQFVIGKWDASSTLGKEDQKRNLVLQWLALGRYDRNVYIKRACDEDWDPGSPDLVPRDLRLREDRYKSWDQVVSVLWVRTWYGNRSSGAPAGDNDIEAVATRKTADASYYRLWQRGFVDPDVPAEAQEVDPAIAIFDEDSSNLAVAQQSIVQDIVPVGEVPFFSCFHPDAMSRLIRRQFES